MVAPSCDGGTGGPGSFVARDFALETVAEGSVLFLSPIKGPNLEQITVEVGSGIRPAAEAAGLYDQDVEKQAKQLGLPNW